MSLHVKIKTQSLRGFLIFPYRIFPYSSQPLHSIQYTKPMSGLRTLVNPADVSVADLAFREMHCWGAKQNDFSPSECKEELWSLSISITHILINQKLSYTSHYHWIASSSSWGSTEENTTWHNLGLLCCFPSPESQKLSVMTIFLWERQSKIKWQHPLHSDHFRHGLCHMISGMCVTGYGIRWVNSSLVQRARR